MAKLAAMLGPDGKPLAPLDATKAVDVKAQPVLDAKTIANLDPKAVEALLKGQTAETQTKAGSLEAGKALEAGKTNALDATTKGLDAAKGVNVNATTAALEVAAQLGKSTVADKAQAGSADAQSKAEGALKVEQGKLDATTAAKQRLCKINKSWMLWSSPSRWQNSNQISNLRVISSQRPMSKPKVILNRKLIPSRRLLTRLKQQS